MPLKFIWFSGPFYFLQILWIYYAPEHQSQCNKDSLFFQVVKLKASGGWASWPSEEAGLQTQKKLDTKSGLCYSLLTALSGVGIEHWLLSDILLFAVPVQKSRKQFAERFVFFHWVAAITIFGRVFSVRPSSDRKHPAKYPTPLKP